MAQPPADHVRGAAALLHYTWGSIFRDRNANDSEVWKFDKRCYTAKDVALKVRLPMADCCEGGNARKHTRRVAASHHRSLSAAIPARSMVISHAALRRHTNGHKCACNGRCEVSIERGCALWPLFKCDALQVPRIEEPPAWRQGLALQDGVTVTPDLTDILRAMVRRMNEASADLPTLTLPARQ
jgi:hypothetical protein